MTEDQQKQFDKIEKERRSREENLLLLLILLGEEAKLHARAAVRLGHDPVDAANSVIIGEDSIDQPGLAAALAESMADAEFAGFERAYRMAGIEPPEPGQSDLYQLGELYRNYATATTGALDQQIAERIRQGLAGGETVPEVIRAISEQLKQGGFTRLNDSALARVSTESILQAYNVGLWNGYKAPEVWDRLLGFTHCSVITETTTDICRERNQLTLRKDHPYFRNNWPKLHWGCRSGIIGVFKGQSFVESDFLPTIPPMAGFGRAPIAAFGYAFA